MICSGLFSHSGAVVCYDHLTSLIICVLNGLTVSCASKGWYRRELAPETRSRVITPTSTHKGLDEGAEWWNNLIGAWELVIMKKISQFDWPTGDTSFHGKQISVHMRELAPKTGLCNRLPMGLAPSYQYWQVYKSQWPTIKKDSSQSTTKQNKNMTILEIRYTDNLTTRKIREGLGLGFTFPIWRTEI